MKRTLIVTFFLCLCGMVKSECVFSGYKFVIVEPVVYDNNIRDSHGIEKRMLNEINNCGLLAYSNDAIPEYIMVEYRKYPGQFLYLSINHNGDNNLSLSMNFTNMEGKSVYYVTKSTNVYMYHFTFEGALRSLLNRCAYEYEEAMRGYKFDASKTPKNKCKHIDITYNEARAYLDSTKLDEVEGIYKSFDSDASYKIFIRANEAFGYDIIIMEDYKNLWFVGDLKAKMESAAVDGVFSGQWLTFDKNNLRGFLAKYENGVLDVIVEGLDANKYLKLYPKLTTSNKPKSSKGGNQLVASGSGFLVNSQGIIATNNHVIEGATKIMVTFTDGLNQLEYNAKLLLTDKTNDVALLQVIDSVAFSKTPYGFCSTAEIGVDVFTIGFPRPNSMGENFKVTNGIVSALSGVEDDVREYQITVPIQPGNSGGALFDMFGNVIGVTTATLNEDYLNAKVENVNYAVKVSYLINLYNMLPNAPVLNSPRTQKAELTEMVKRFKNYVCLIKIYE